MNPHDLDRLLARATADLERSIVAANVPHRSVIGVRPTAARWGRVAATLIALTGASAIAVIVTRNGVVPGGSGGGEPPQVSTVQETPTAAPLPDSTIGGSGPTSAAPTSAAPDTSPSTPSTDAMVVPDGDPVGLAYQIPDDAIPGGYRMVAAFDSGVGTPTGQPPVFHGVLAMFDDQGLPTTPAIHVEVQNEPPPMDGAATPVDINGLSGEYVVWNQQMISATSSPTADVRWQLPTGQWMIVSGPSLDFILLQVARSAALNEDGSVDVTPPSGFTYVPGWLTFGPGSGAGIVYEGPALGTLAIRVQRTDDSMVFESLRSNTASNLTIRNGAPALEFAGPRGLSSVSFEPAPGIRVTVTHASPRTDGDLNARLPLDRATIDLIIDSLERIDGDAWLDLQRQMAAAYTPTMPPFAALPGFGNADASLTGAVPVPITLLDGTSMQSWPVEFTRSVDGQYRLRYGDQGGINLSARPGVSAYRGNMAVQGLPVLLGVGDDVEEVVMIRPSGERVAVALLEVAPDLLPGYRYGYIDPAGEDVQIETSSSTGAIETTALSQL